MDEYRLTFYEAYKMKIWFSRMLFLLMLCVMLGGLRHDIFTLRTQSPLFYQMLKQTMQIIQPGDLIFTRGQGFFSHYFAKMSVHDQRFSHVGFIVEDSFHSMGVRHALADEITAQGSVQTSTLYQFLADSQEWAIYRLRFSPSQRQNMINFSLLLEKKQTPFDYHFDLTDQGKAVYCTELVWYSVKQATGIDLIANKYHSSTAKKRIVTLDDLSQNPLVFLVNDFRVSALSVLH